MKTVLTTAALIVSLIASSGVAAATPIMDNCSDPMVRCSPVAAPRTTAGAFQGSLGWQASGQQGVRGWHER